MSGPSPMESLAKYVRCQALDGIIVCPKHFTVMPFHTGNRRKYCFRHREKFAEIEATELVAKMEGKT